jgi:hypothetical protein
MLVTGKLLVMTRPVPWMAQDCSKRILGIGFRLLGYSRNSDSVVSTASATVRQVRVYRTAAPLQ